MMKRRQRYVVTSEETKWEPRPSEEMALKGLRRALGVSELRRSEILGEMLKANGIVSTWARALIRCKSTRTVK